MGLGELERSVMDLLWDRSVSLTATEVREALAQHGAQTARPLAVTTVLTVLSRLEKKGLVRREGDRRPHRYAPLASREEHTAGLLHEVLGSAPDREAVLARFIGGISADETAALRRLLSR
ncbi:BlaI/MecI/CopY family transcriptional regulator [Micrococcus terreus]|uniref:BlaI/MecI/CopY family transcriptional regulator n=1 Tax=Micrococcus terreus TaxID=574650 RepID=UPI0033E3A3A3